MALDIAAIRERFPALALTDQGRRRIYMDNPAGTQVPRVVLERVQSALVQCNANFGGYFSTSIEATELSHQAHLAMADLLNATSEREIVFGPNMTTLTFVLSRSLAGLLRAGDEILLTRMEHDANSTPWRILARERGLVIRVLDFDPASGQFDLTQLDRLLTDKLRFAAIGYANNLIGTVNDVGEFCRRTRDVGALTFVDAVQCAPHRPIDVQAIGCDFLACSAYKFFGPHQGVLWARESLLDRLEPYKLRASSNELPGRYETGTQSLEGQAGTLGAIEYLQWIGTTMAREHEATFPQFSGRRLTLHAAMAAIAEYERSLSLRLIEGLRAIPGLAVHGIVDPELATQRVPTVSWSRRGVDPADCARELNEEGIFAWSGNAYALDVVDRLGLTAEGGVLRLGAVHYNTLAEIDEVVAAVARLPSLRAA